VAILGAALASGSAPHPAPPPRPNVLLIQVDDQAMNTFRPQFMPDVWRWIVRPGTKFTAGLAAPPLCCPDRAGILTGQYPHNNGVFSNDPGYPTLHDKGDTLPVWLRNAGYRTGLDGKFLNNYPETEGAAPAPGFSDWFSYDGRPAYFRYTISDGGQLRRFGPSRAAYSTDVFTRHAKEFVREGRDTGKPFFLWLAYDAPHDTAPAIGDCGNYVPLPPSESEYRRFGSQVKFPLPPAYDERDISDKPSFIASKRPITKARPHIARRFRCVAATMHEVDKQVGKLMRWLQQTGQLKNTIVVYVSDNGYYYGEHRLIRGKSWPYEPALNVPYAVRLPTAYQGVKPPPRVSPEVVSEQDIASTILDYAGDVPSCKGPHVCRVVDGRSLRPLLGGEGRWPQDRGVLAEINSSGIDYSAIRTKRYMYTEYSDGEREIYDLVHDPFEKTNLIASPRYAGIIATLAKRLSRLRTCSGLHGQRACQ
jgi:N-acetylglucosamine-6-sulfatase